jgi:hypothetical protein
LESLRNGESFRRAYPSFLPFAAQQLFVADRSGGKKVSLGGCLKTVHQLNLCVHNTIRPFAIAYHDVASPAPNHRADQASQHGGVNCWRINDRQNVLAR